MISQGENLICQTTRVICYLVMRRASLPCGLQEGIYCNIYTSVASQVEALIPEK